MIEFNSNSEPVLTIGGDAPRYLTIYGDKGRIAAINMQDGTVTIDQEGDAPEAAKVFWRAISSCLQTVVKERDELKEKVERLEATFAEELEALRDEFELTNDWTKLYTPKESL